MPVRKPVRVKIGAGAQRGIGHKLGASVSALSSSYWPSVSAISSRRKVPKQFKSIKQARRAKKK